MQHADWEEEQREERWRAVMSDGRVRDKTGREKGQNCKVRMEETETKRSSACSSELQDKTLSHSFRKWWKDRTANQTWGLDNWGRDRGYQVCRSEEADRRAVSWSYQQRETWAHLDRRVAWFKKYIQALTQTFKHSNISLQRRKL